MLEPTELENLKLYRRAADYIGAAQIYLKSNALLKEPLKLEHIKERLLGHWGTVPGINLVYAHLNGRGCDYAGAVAPVGDYLRDLFRRTEETRNFRLVCPDETTSNKLQAVFEATDRAFTWPTEKKDSRRTGDGDPLRAHVRGVSRRVPADRPARDLPLLRGVHRHH